MRRFASVASRAAAVLALVSAVAPRSWAAPWAAPLGQDATLGYELYVRIGCYQCHGFEGQGAGPTGPRLAPNPIAFNRFLGIVYDPIDLMPRYPPDYVSEQDVRDIYAYLQTIPRPPAPDEIPLLNP